MTGIHTLRIVLVASAGVIMSINQGSCQTPQTNDSPSATSATTTFVTELGNRLDAGVRDGKWNNLHAVVVVGHRELLFERYYEGMDERWGQALGPVKFTPETLHDLRSVSKSVVGLLYGIALDEGKVPSLDQSLVSFLPQYADLSNDPVRQRITVAHALSMQLGLEWDESFPYADARNSEIAMEKAPDRCRFVLERPFVDEPGTRWNYSGGATALLACLITEGTDMTLLDYTRARLFSPLGIEHVEWVTGRDGIEVAASGLRMRPRDLAKIGQLVLNRGTYNGAQLVPANWIEASFEPHARVDDDFDYGYQWWIARRWSWVAAFGNGGQRMTVLPRPKLVLVVSAGNYNSPDAWKVPVGVLVDVVLPSLNQ